MRGNGLTSKRYVQLLCFFLLLYFPQFLIGQNENVRFDQIDIKDGLSQNNVFCIFQDKKGFMWFGTQEGLNKYDGRDFTIYNSTTVKLEKGEFGNIINDICQDYDGNIWVATDKDLIKFDPIEEKFFSIKKWDYDKDVRAVCIDSKGFIWTGAGNDVVKVDPKGNECVGSKEIGHMVQAICLGNEGDVWVGTENGLFKIDINKKDSNPEPYDLEGNKARSILKIYKDSTNNIWVGTEDGLLLKYKKDRSLFEAYFKNEYGIGLRAIEEYDEDNLWLGFDGDGIVIFPKPGKELYSLKEETLSHIKRNFYIPGGLRDNFVQAIFKDNSGTMWIGTRSEGVHKYNAKKVKFISYYNMPGKRNSLQGHSIFSIFEDNEGFTWIGTYSGELNKFKFDPNSRTQKFEFFKDKAFIGKSILSINEDSTAGLWIGTTKGGFFLCTDKKKGKFELIKSYYLKNIERIRVIEKDRDGRHLWIGTALNGILKFDPQTKTFSDGFSTENGLSDNNIYSIFPDTDKNIIWIGTSNALHKADKESGKAIPVKNKDGKDKRIFSIVTDPNDNTIFWIGTDKGLCKFHKNQKEIEKTWTTTEGLPNDTVYGILKDESGYLWFSTNKGIVKFDPKEEKVESTFDVNDGLQANEFNHGAHFQSQKRGHMYFGGIRGLSVFHPSEIEIDESMPRIYLTKLSAGSEEIKTGKLRLEKSHHVTPKIPKIPLDYKKQPIIVTFSALDYNVPGRIRYKYELTKDGKTKEGKWVSDNFFTFPHLNVGKYTFKVWSTNSYGYYKFEEQTPAEMEIIIKRHWFDIFKSLLIPILVVLGISVLLNINFYFTFKKRAKRRIEKLEMIESAIADVSGREHIAEVVFRMLDYIVYKFGFDYGAISQVDFLNSTIETLWVKTREPKLVNPHCWKEERKYKLSETNILTEVVKKGKTIEIIGPSVDINKEKRLNKKIFEDYSEKDLIRVFVPIEYRAKGKDIVRAESNLVFGVIEAGFHRNTRSNIPEEMKIMLELFLNYCSSFFYRAFKRSEKQIVETVLRKSSDIEHHEKYLEMILKDSVKLIGGDKGDISFFSFNEKQINFDDNLIFYDIDNEEDRNLIKKRSQSVEKKGIVRHAAETNHYYYSNDVKSDPYYIEDIEDVNSELAVPMRYSGRVIGVLNIYSTERDFFDERKANIIQIISDEAAKIFQKKKINQTIKNLVLPFHLFVGIEKIYEIIINNIRDYFIDEYVSIWERTEDSDKKYKLINSCNNLKKMYDEYGLRYLKKEILWFDSRNIQLINFENEDCLDCGFNEFAKENDLKSMVFVPIIVDQQVYGFINIFSRRELPSLFAEDETFLNLIATKGAISAQYEKLIFSFMEIFDSLPSENYDRILKNIVDSAARVLHAEPVILFKYEKEKGIFGGTISGFLFHPELKKFIAIDLNRDEYLATSIIKKGTIWFENSKIYKDYINLIERKSSKHFEKDFWTREKIKSSVGIRLEHNGKPIGVMFFNYREKQRFDENTKRFIEAFASLASSGIVNAKYLDLIEKQNKVLEEQKTQLQAQKEKLQFEYEEVFQKMKEMLPRATRTSFYLILEGINHDIRNFLIRMKQATMNIKENSERLYKKERNTINIRIKDIDRNIKNVTNLLKLFNFRNAGKESLNINDLIRELTFFFKTRESESINFNTDELREGIPLITCNKAELSMIIYNLLSNSVYAVAEKKSPDGEIRISTDFKNDEYIIVVEDNGIGIDNNDILHIYDADFSRRKNGLGIGLYFVSETLRESFYGTIECESKYGYWTRFTIKIPGDLNCKEGSNEFQISFY